MSPGADQAQTQERPTRGQEPNFSFDASSQGRGAHLVNETLGSQLGEPGMLVDGFAADGGGDVGVPGYAAGQGVGTKTGGSAAAVQDPAVTKKCSSEGMNVSASFGPGNPVAGTSHLMRPIAEPPATCPTSRNDPGFGNAPRSAK